MCVFRHLRGSPEFPINQWTYVCQCVCFFCMWKWGKTLSDDPRSWVEIWSRQEWRVPSSSFFSSLSVLVSPVFPVPFFFFFFYLIFPPLFPCALNASFLFPPSSWCFFLHSFFFPVHISSSHTPPVLFSSRPRITVTPIHIHTEECSKGRRELGVRN